MSAPLTSGTAQASSVAKPKKKSKLKWYLIGATLLLVALVAVAVVKKRGAAKGISVTTEKAVTKTIVQTVTATGKIQPEVEVKITPEVFGEIISLPYREGAVVKKGDVIVKIKPDFYAAQVDQQTAAVAAARSAAVNSLVQLNKAEADRRNTRTSTTGSSSPTLTTSATRRPLTAPRRTASPRWPRSTRPRAS